MTHKVVAYASAVPGRLIMLDFSGPPEDRQAPVTREEIEVVLRCISGVDVRVNALENGSRWTGNTRSVDTYRRRRVLLAADWRKRSVARADACGERCRMTHS
jgi:hypothetical protein